MKSLLKGASLIFLWAASGFAALPEPPKILKKNVQVRFGIGEACAPGRWTALSIEITNPGGENSADFRGILEIHGIGTTNIEAITDAAIYRLPLDLPRQTTRRVNVPVRAGDWEGGLRIELRGENGQESKFYFKPFEKAPRSSKRLLLISDRVPNHEALEGWLKRVAPARRDPISLERRSRFAIVQAAPSDLSSHPCAYAPFQVAVLLGSTLSGEGPETVAALRAWVEAGGTLVVLPGPPWGGGIRRDLQELLKVVPGELSIAAPASLLGEGVTNDNVFFRELVPASGGEWTAGGRAIRGRTGTGLTVTFRGGPTGDAFPAQTEAPAIYSVLTEALARASSFDGDPEPVLAIVERYMPPLLFSLSYPSGTAA